MHREHRHDQQGHRRHRRARPPTRPAQGAIERLATAVGNHAFAALVARPGAGILPGGRAHPDVEAAIARTRGGGRPLDAGVRDRLAPQLGDPLHDVRVHTDATAQALTRAVSARAFVTGRDVFFSPGEFRPGTADGDRLLAHELTHVVQQRDAPVTGPLRVSEPGDPMEVEADVHARRFGG